MCGIIGYMGLYDISNSVLIEGLGVLEYRGCDSARIAIVHDSGVQVVKTRGGVGLLKEKMEAIGLTGGQVRIAHTRRATHGEPSEINSHPHQSGNTMLVHNGVIENYNGLKRELENAGYTFKSDTNSKIACTYINYCYFLKKDKQQTLTCAYHHLRGSFIFVTIFADEADVIYAMRKSSPLVLDVASDKAFLASDISALPKYTSKYLFLEHEEIAHCSSEGIIIKTLDGGLVKRDIFVTDLDIRGIQKDGFEHFMLKEIHEEPGVVKKTIDSLIQMDMKDLLDTMPNLAKYNDIHITACGNAMYAGMIAKSLVETRARIHVDCVYASEYHYANPIFTGRTLIILISQSGETADAITALRLAEEHGADTLAIVNVVGSTITREADFVICTKAGPEICITTTKAYCTQAAILSLIACNLAYVHGDIDAEEAARTAKELKDLPQHMQQLINSDQYKAFAKRMYGYNDIFFISRSLDYSLSIEGSLKLREISYIHPEAHAAGELKHGTISLIEEGTPVIALTADGDLYEKTISNTREVKARGAYTVLLIGDDLDIASSYYDGALVVPKVDKLIQGILTVISLQPIAYEIAKLRGCEIDQPCNLARSVTIE